jgi:Fe-S-cluster containining protein
MAKKLYNCLKCVAYCCTYTHIPATKRDVARLAKHFGITPKEAARKFTKAGDKENPRVMRHSADEHFGSACMFLDQETRQCTVYKARPQICRDFPTQNRCGYYEFLKFERDVQDDPKWVATTS